MNVADSERMEGQLEDMGLMKADSKVGDRALSVGAWWRRCAVIDSWVREQFGGTPPGESLHASHILASVHVQLNYCLQIAHRSLSLIQQLVRLGCVLQDDANIIVVNTCSIRCARQSRSANSAFMPCTPLISMSVTMQHALHQLHICTVLCLPHHITSYK
jgi:hypothetical protein